LAFPSCELTFLILGYQGVTTACASVLGGSDRGMPTNTIIGASIALLIIPVGLLVFALCKLRNLPSRVEFDKEKGEWMDKGWQSDGGYHKRYRALFEDFKSIRYAMLFGSLHVAKMLVVGVLIGLLSR